ncbi:hypothetical protein EII17_11525 [Clostridiales bacterium COT073_COT-073]|nr:hypothetical protein EII17_11525 [Clostridiales bacterium COT073_COT-073]
MESTQTQEEHYVDVDNFVITAYWENKDLPSAAAEDCLIAEYHQKSDYNPVTNNKQKVSLQVGISD